MGNKETTPIQDESIHVGCLNCGFHYSTDDIFEDSKGKHVQCPKCGSSFDI